VHFELRERLRGINLGNHGSDGPRLVTCTGEQVKVASLGKHTVELLFVILWLKADIHLHLISALIFDINFINFCNERVIIPMAHFETLKIFFVLVLKVWLVIVVIVIVVVILLASRTSLLTLPLSIVKLGSPHIDVVSQLPFRERQIVATSWVAVHVFDFDLEQADDDVLVFNYSFWLIWYADGLANYVLRWVVVDDLLISTSHADTLVSFKVFRLCGCPFSTPFQNEFGALFLKNRQQ